MSHSELVNEVIRQLTTRFHPDPGQIKKRVESLIEVRSCSSSEDTKLRPHDLSENTSSAARIANRIITW
jgi:hypothetical protein